LPTKTYDLVLLDTMMPDLDGIETTRRIRAMHVPSAEVPIVALVAQTIAGPILRPAWMPA
jgi:CheY-like chemotaxis protein